LSDSDSSSKAIHSEDNGVVYSSIRNDGIMIHWCTKCKRVWISKEEPHIEVLEGKMARRAVMLTQKEIDEVKAKLQKLSTK
jgi:hypothetical protein